MNVYNRQGVFSNATDTAEELESILRLHYADVTVELRGTVALFEATAP
jgi:hypothetical protein